MHELSLCAQIQRIVARAAADRPVAVVHLKVGQLRQVVPDTLAYCWSLVVEGTPLAGSTLAVESVPVTASCRVCGHLTTVEHTLVLLCAACGSGDIELRTGEEFLLTSLDLHPTPSSSTSEA